VPNYEWECEECGFVFEQFVRLNDFAKKTTQTCPSCLALAHRKVSAPGIIFRGPGWTPKGR
jgi:putative FmdB family regulatory protein